MPMSTERLTQTTLQVDGNKARFPVTRSMYLEGATKLVEAALSYPNSKLAQKLQEEADSIGNNNVLTPNEPIYIPIGKHLLPIALPIDYKPEKRSRENRHNVAQMYLFGEEDELLDGIAEIYDAKRQGINLHVRHGVLDMLHLLPPEASPTELTIKKTQARGTVLQIKSAARKGLSYEELREQGFSDVSITQARKSKSQIDFPVSIPERPEKVWTWQTVMENLQNPNTERSLAITELAKVSRGIQQAYTKEKNGQPALFITISSIAHEAGLRINQRRSDATFLFEYLKEKGLPVGVAENILYPGTDREKRQRYYFTTKWFRDEAVALLQKAEGEYFTTMRTAYQKRYAA